MGDSTSLRSDSSAPHVSERKADRSMSNNLQLVAAFANIINLTGHITRANRKSLTDSGYFNSVNQMLLGSFQHIRRRQSGFRAGDQAG